MLYSQGAEEPPARAAAPVRRAVEGSGRDGEGAARCAGHPFLPREGGGGQFEAFFSAHPGFHIFFRFGSVLGIGVLRIFLLY